jgi:type IV secretory pathway VirB4 component
VAHTPAQNFLEIDQIKEGVLVMKNNSLRGVIATSSLNFALKSEDEQNAIIYQFQNFLNSLDFSIEVVVQSRKLNITGYLEKLKEVEKDQTIELLKIQTGEYRKFIEGLIAGGSIMAKNFFVVVPFTAIEIPGATAISGLFTKKTSAALNEEQFQRAKSQLWQRLEFTAIGLRRCGLQCSPLGTEELITFLWSAYHPAEAEVGYYPEIPPELIR